MGKIKFFLLAFFSLALLLFFVALSYLIVVGRDEAVPSDSDLQPAKLKLSSFDNIYYYLSEASDFSQLSLNDKEYVASFFKSGDFNIVKAQDLVIKNKDFLNAFRKATGFSKYQDPSLADWEQLWAGSPSENRARFKEAADFYLFSCAELFYQGKEKEALDEVLKVVKIAKSIQTASGTIKNYQLGLDIKQRALELFKILISRARLASSPLKSFINGLDQYQQPGLALSETLKTEYFSAVNTQHRVLDLAIAQDRKTLGLFRDILFIWQKKLLYYYQPNKTKRLIGDYFRQLIANINKSSFQEGRDASLRQSAAPTGWAFWQQRFILKNSIGQEYIDEAITDLRLLNRDFFLEKFQAQAVLVLTALKAYYQDNKRLPDSLADLVPAYLPVLPLDPFDGSPLRYSAQKSIFYSVGPNLNDIGGDTGEDLSQMENPTVPIRFTGQ